MLIPFNNLFSKYNIKSTGIIHVGASLGQEAQRYYDLGMEDMILIEAIPDIFLQLKQNIAKFSNAIAVNSCVSDIDDQEIIFNIANNDGQSSSMLEFGTHTEQHPTVKFIDKIKLKTIRLDTLLNNCINNLNKYDFLVMDLQGAELMALKGLGVLLNNFNHVYLEVNRDELYKGCALISEIDDYLAKFNFERKETKILNFGWGDAYYSKIQ